MRRLVPVAALALAACSGESGALSQASFGAGCAAGGACVRSLDAPLAVGSRLPIVVDLELPGTAAVPVRLASGAPAVFEVEGNVAVAKLPGVGVLLLHGPEDVVVDFVHLWTAEPEGLVLARLGPEGAVLGRLSSDLTLVPGDEVLFSAEAVAGGQELLGEFDAAVENAGAAVRVLEAGIPRWFRILAREPGVSELAVSALGQETALRVEVLP